MTKQQPATDSEEPVIAESIYLVNPYGGQLNYYGFEVLAGKGYRPACLCADLAIVTVAAMADEYLEVSICDEALSPADLDTSADIVGITGKLSQVQRMIELAGEYRARGKQVVIGGPFATLSPDVLRPHCDVLVQGEIEEVAGALFSDLRAGQAKDEYFGGRPNLTTSPVPRWDLYPNERAVNGTLQTARGCPFGCEFCDVIQYNGRKQRFKTTDQVLTELDELYARGYRSAMVAGGMIVGFDADDGDIFARQLEFAMASGVPIYACGALMAPDKTPLHDRLEKAGRLRDTEQGGGGNPFTTNIVHPTMGTDELLGGLKWLVNQLYNPTAFAARMKMFIEMLGDRHDPDFFEPMRFIDNRRVLREAAQMVTRHADVSDADGRMIAEVLEAVEKKPSVRMFVWETMIHYMQVRYTLEQGGYWEPGCPPFAEQRAESGVAATTVS